MRSIRWKLMIVVSLLVAVPILILNEYAVRVFDRFTSHALEKEMVSHALAAGLEYQMSVENPRRAGEKADALGQFIRLLADNTGSRIIILSPGGIVLSDSATNRPAGTDMSARPEVAKAKRTGGRGSSWELTPDRKLVYYYVCQPVRGSDGRITGFVHLSRTTAEITRTILGMVSFHRLVIWIAIPFAMLIAAVVAQTMTGRLRRLTKAAAEFAAGRGAMNADVGGRDEIGILASTVTGMAAELDRRNTYNKEFVSTVVHELRMPLTAIKGAAEVLEQGAVDDPKARGKFLSNIRYEADRMTRLVSELTEMTKIDAETAAAAREEIDLVACVRDVLERLEATLDQEHAVIRRSLPAMRVMVSAVPARIEQVLCNLIENAVRYTPVGGEIEIRICEPAAGEVVTQVKDTGCGIAASNIGKVFDRFFTTEPKDKPKDYGSGLGLAIARSIVEAHRGRIWVESEQGKGACFSFSLPVSLNKPSR